MSILNEEDKADIFNTFLINCLAYTVLSTTNGKNSEIVQGLSGDFTVP